MRQLRQRRTSGEVLPVSTRPWTTCCKPVQHIGSSILGPKTRPATEGFNVNCKTSSATIRGVNFPTKVRTVQSAFIFAECSVPIVGVSRGAGTRSTPPLRTSPCHVRVGWFSERGYNIPHARRSTRPGIPTPNDLAVFEGRDREVRPKFKLRRGRRVRRQGRKGSSEH